MCVHIRHAFTHAPRAGAHVPRLRVFLSLRSRFKELGATFVGGPDWGSHVVVDGKLITAQNPGSAVACAKKVIEMLA